MMMVKMTVADLGFLEGEEGWLSEPGEN